jgi:Putative zinc-finger
MSCPTLETVAAWVLSELLPEEAERFEEHYFGCASCFHRALRIEQLAKQLATRLPPLLTSERHAALASGGRLETVHVAAGQSAQLRLSRVSAVGVWILHAALDGVGRVDLEARSAEGRLLFAFNDVPFDAERGQVLLACQLHYRALPMDPKMFVQLRESDEAGGRELGRYILDHQFDSA